MCQIDAADGSIGVHTEMLGERNAGLFFSLQPLEKRGLFAEIGAGRIAQGGTNAPVALSNQVVVIKSFIGCISPELLTHPKVQQLRKSLRQTVGQGLQQNGAVIVVVGLKLSNPGLNTFSGTHGKPTNIVLFPTLLWGHKI